ncbi:hypothetical protein E4U03_03495 [Rothia nasimurium]|uniref:PD-(D/E)XK endonuclease-like domain-containing protein n=1 Tax=Rothia nasimurium TaxID=85336 RepID=A0A4Y9F576_9MICC|nr:PD-(D/E)XK nuclease family protein [Rothia nasimurium]MBF0807681.1 hypothetical protein [Rothia nasimurium]TFU23415.1 hypothetical protein E4U03_03495 [Rothia nasimurium]
MFFIDADSAPSLPAVNLEPLGQSLIYSATDLVTSAQCQFATLYALDQALGRVPRLERIEDPQLRRAAALGEAHEQRVLDDFVRAYGTWDPASGQGVYQVEPPRTYTRQALEEKREETLEALRAGADVVFQASFFDGSFHGRADFLVKQPDGSYRVVDTKLARTARVPALLQVAAYADQLHREGIPCNPYVSLILGNNVESLHELATLTPVFEQKRQRLVEILTTHREPGAAPVSWFVEAGSPEITRCGRCDTCQVMVREHRDMLLTSGITAKSRQTIYERCGVQSIDELAALAGQPQLPALVRRYAEQAALQTGVSEPDGAVVVEREGQEHTVSYKLLPRHSLRMLPRASTGDLFMSLRSDPLWRDEKAAHPSLAWGLTYLLGATHLADQPGEEPLLSQFWASSRATEGRLLTDFLGMLHHQRQLNPGLRVYYFGAPVMAALQQLASVHGVGEAFLTDLQREGVFIDLSEVLRRSMRLSEGTRALTAIEPLYAQGLEPDLDIPVTAFADVTEAEKEGRAEQAEAMRAALTRSLYRTGLSLSQLRA